MFIFSNVLRFCALTCVLLHLPWLSALLHPFILLALVAQLCPTLCDSMDPPGSSVHRVLQARILQWVAIPFSRGSFPLRDRTQLSCIAGRFFTVWATREALLLFHLFFIIIFLPHPDLVFYSIDIGHSARRSTLCTSWHLLPLLSACSLLDSQPWTLIIVLRFLNLLFSVS